MLKTRNPPRMKNLTEVIDCLEDIRSFLEQNSHAEEATRTDELLSAVTRLKMHVLCSSINYRFFPKR